MIPSTFRIPRLINLGFARRIATIVGLVFFIVIAVAVASEFLARDRIVKRSVALPERIAATIDLLDGANKERRDAILRAVQSSDLSVQITRERQTVPSSGKRHPVAEWALQQQFANPDQHNVFVISHTRYKNRPVAAWLERRSAASTAPLTITVQLRDSSYVVFRTFGSVGRQIFGLPPGFAIGIVGALLAIVAIAIVSREAKPLRSLRESVDAFSLDARPRPVRKRGAPDIQKLIGAVNAMQSRIAQLMSGRTIMIGAISHDMRTFLTRLRLRMETHPDGDTRMRAIDDLDAMTDLLDQSLMFAKRDHSHTQQEVINLKSLLTSEVSEYDAAKVFFIDKTDERQVEIEGQIIAIRRLFNNLIENAFGFGDRVEVCLSVRNGCAVVQVDDDGPGIPKSKRQLVFEPFYRIEKSRSRETGGSGLGLAIAHQTVSDLGGTIEVSSSDLGGARVEVTLQRS